MANLFIIGNGFDLAHKLNTGYEHFRQYLSDELTDKGKLDYYGTWNPPQTTKSNHGEEIISKDDLLAFTINLYDYLCNLDKKWSDLEAQTAKIPYSFWLNETDVGIKDREGDNDVSATGLNYEIISQNLKIAVSALPRLVENWIKTINIDEYDPEGKISMLINTKQDLFLSFNYTMTLEKKYGIPYENICHIHGKCEEEVIKTIPSCFSEENIESNIKVGHNEGNAYDKFNKFSPYPNIPELISEILNSLNKNISENIKRNKSFFNMISTTDIQNIYSFGFSYNNIDENYIKEIIKTIKNPSAIWHFDGYCPAEDKVYANKIRSYGYKGKICLHNRQFFSD